ncbi:MAG: nicotinate (nicotinamide) nucleotide adenylyltransferase [Chloroflexi bacterium]|nr:MAG: nicotinate (nicotinamide) nucleotide adenylyltransferase [Chloroflexota bacterium]TMF56013.1 MAG: nicotinate (nicotinamide) nucleotide adenylyltransferase [Chloroflexota bacterium]
MTARIGVFGGTFDPVHVGHLAIALAALESVPLDRVLFVPVRRSPLKDRDPLASTTDRVAMLETAIAREPRFALSRAELEREGVSYTVDTLEELRSQGELFLILGSDALADLARWRAPDRIRELATILVAARPGAPEPDAMHGARTFDAPRLDISSRELRARAARGMSLRYLVPDAVWEHIKRHGLYR